MMPFITRFRCDICGEMKDLNCKKDDEYIEYYEAWDKDKKFKGLEGTQRTICLKCYDEKVRSLFIEP